ncbi:uncharacterized protein TNCV_2724061 [Trichonephila clavipes]|nr:uncharacterized protein TNCV_2724061 [Trichonephila clavipes]
MCCLDEVLRNLSDYGPFCDCPLPYEEANIIEFERGRIIELQEGGFSFRDVAEKLGRNVSTVHNFWQQWSRDGTSSRRPGSERPRGTNEREDHRIRRTAVVHCNEPATEIRVAVGTTVTQRTVRNRLLQGPLYSINYKSVFFNFLKLLLSLMPPDRQRPDRGPRNLSWLSDACR